MNPRAILLERALPPLYWVMLAAALWILLRGHNEPGGGFIAGLVAVSATSVLAIVVDPGTARRRLPLAPVPLAAAGVGLALLSGLPAVLLGRPYLTHLWATIPLGLMELRVSTVLAFDLGVLLAVWGTLSGYVLALLPGGPPGDPAP